MLWHGNNYWQSVLRIHWLIDPWCFFDVGLNKLLKKISRCWWFEIGRHSCDITNVVLRMFVPFSSTKPLPLQMLICNQLTSLKNSDFVSCWTVLKKYEYILAYHLNHLYWKGTGNCNHFQGIAVTNTSYKVNTIAVAVILALFVTNNVGPAWQCYHHGGFRELSPHAEQ